MKRQAVPPDKRSVRATSFLAGLLLALACMGSVSPEQATEMIVVNPGVRSSELSHTALRSVFSMRLRQWPDGSPLRVFVLPDKNPVHAEFSKRILGVFPHQLRWAWDRLVFSGTGQAPETVESEEEMREKLASTPGAIGYLSSGMVDDSVRVLRIEDSDVRN